MSLLEKYIPLPDFIEDKGLENIVGQIVFPTIAVPSIGEAFKIVVASNDQRVIVQPTDGKGTPVLGREEERIPYITGALKIKLS